MLKIGPQYKIARRLGPIFEKTQTQKFATRLQQREQRAGRRRGRQPSAYALELLEKQKLRFSYGLKEKHLANYVEKALNAHDATDKTLFALLERRLDSIVYRAGFAATRRQARQLVSHGHFLHNGRRVTVPSIQVQVGDTIEVRQGSKSSPLFSDLAGRLNDHKNPAWITSKLQELQIEVVDNPSTTIYEFDYKKIIEYYTR
ncbi:MAG: 30S ribosomal protein S4 [Patescibacteria group bacterium]